MKLTTYLFAIFLVVNLFTSCTPNDSVEEGLEYESQSYVDSGGEDDTPLDNEKNGQFIGLNPKY